MEDQIILASDLHLTETVYNEIDLRGDSFYSFNQLVDYTCKQPNTALGLLGDVLNVRRPSSEVMRVLLTGLDKLRACGKQVYVIQGQHDMANPPWATLQSNVTWAHRLNVEIGNHIFHFIDYMHRPVLQEYLANIPPQADALCCHQATKESLNFGIEDIETRAYDFELCDLPEHIRFAYMGDVHEAPRVLKCDSGTIGSYCGSTYMCRWTENSDKSFINLDCRQNVPQIKRVPLVTRAFKHYRLFTDAQVDAFITSAVSDIRALNTNIDYENMSMPFVVIEYATDLKDIITCIKDMCATVNTAVPCFFKLVARVRKINNNEVFTGNVFDIGPTAGLQQLVDPDKQPELFKLCTELLESDYDSIRNVISTYKAKFEVK